MIKNFLKCFVIFFTFSFILFFCIFVFGLKNVDALVNNKNLINVNASYFQNSLLVSRQNVNTFLYDNFYYSDETYGANLYLLGYNVYNVPQLNNYITNNINFYFDKPCSSSENLNYNLIVRFYKNSTDTMDLSRINVILGNSGCTGYWQRNGDNWDYVLTCNMQPDSFVVGSLTFDISNLTIPRGADIRYRIAIQKNFTYSCEVNSQAIIENNNINSQNIINNQNNNTNSINNSINNVNNTISDDSVDDPSSQINQFNDLIPQNGVITQLISLPITLYQSVLNGLNSSCSTFELGSLYGKNLSLPCINVSSYVGSTLWGVIDVLISGFFIFTISKKFINVFESFTSLKEGDVID